jgi:hypothetical protein
VQNPSSIPDATSAKQQGCTTANIPCGVRHLLVLLVGIGIFFKVAVGESIRKTHALIVALAVVIVALTAFWG